jgi:hypothetical protein
MEAKTAGGEEDRFLGMTQCDLACLFPSSNGIFGHSPLP